MDALFDPVPAASLLADAWRRGDQLVELPVTVRPRTLAEGYDVQDRLMVELGDEVAGWKLGVGSPRAKRQAGLARAIAGRVLRSSCHRPGKVVRLANPRPATVELEVAFVLACDMAPDEAPAAASTLIAAAHVTVELVLARFVDRRAVGWPSFAADDAGFAALVVGEAIDPARIAELAASISVEANGQVMARSVDQEDLIEPMTAFGEMLDHARERGLRLARGTVISTGTMSQPFEIDGPSNSIVARYLGSSLEFATAAG